MGRWLVVVGVLSVCIGHGTAVAAQEARLLDRFVGTWVEDESRRELGSIGELRFRTSGGQLEEVSGRAAPRVQVIVFDGIPRRSDVDSQASWKRLDATTVQRTLTEAGQVVSVRTLRLSSDGKTLTQDVSRRSLDGRERVVTTVFERREGSEGLEGVWQPRSFKSTRPADLRIERAAGGARLVEGGGGQYAISLDGTPQPVTGLGVLNGSTAATRAVGAAAFEVIGMRDGREVGRETLSISGDGRTLTRRMDGGDVVYVKQ